MLRPLVILLLALAGVINARGFSGGVSGLSEASALAFASDYQSDNRGQFGRQSPAVETIIDVFNVQPRQRLRSSILEKETVRNPVLPYCSALLVADYEYYNQLELLSFVIPTPVDRSLVALYFVINSIAEEVEQGISYDTAYNAVETLLTFAKWLTTPARDIVVKNLNTIYVTLTPFRNLVKENLNNYAGLLNRFGSIDANELSACDRRVDSIVRNNRQYQGLAALAISAGQFSQAIQAKSAEFQTIASTQSEQQYLENSKQSLKSFILIIASNLRNLNKLLSGRTSRTNIEGCSQNWLKSVQSRDRSTPIVKETIIEKFNAQPRQYRRPSLVKEIVIDEINVQPRPNVRPTSVKETIIDEFNAQPRQYRRPSLVKEIVIDVINVQPRPNVRPTSVKETIIDEFNAQPRQYRRPSPVKEIIIDEFNVQPRPNVRPTSVKETIVEEFSVQPRQQVRSSPLPRFRQKVPQRPTLRPELHRIVLEKVSIAPLLEDLIANSKEVDDRNPVVPYCSALLIADHEYYNQLEQLSFVVPTPAERSYASLLFVLNVIADKVAQGVNYDSAYNIEDILLALGQLLPDEARDYVVNFFQTAFDTLNPFRDLVNNNLNNNAELVDGFGSIDANELSACDRRVDSIVRNNRQYQGLGALAISFAQLVRAFEANRAEFQAVVAMQSEQQFLANSKLSLKSFIFTLVRAIRILNELVPGRTTPTICVETLGQNWPNNVQPYNRPSPVVKETIIEEFNVKPRPYVRPTPVKETIVEEFSVKPRQQVRSSPIVQEIVIEEYQPNYRKNVRQQPTLHPELRRIIVEKVSIAPRFGDLIATCEPVEAIEKLSGQHPVLPYCSALLYADTEYYIKLKRLSFEVPTPSDRSFASLLFALLSIGEGVAQGLNYDTAYITEGILLNFGHFLPREARDFVVNYLSTVHNTLNPIRDLVYQNLNRGAGRGLGSIDANELSVCDRRVDAIVRNNRQYRGLAALTISSAQLAQAFEAKRAQIDAVVAKQSEKWFLDNSKQALEPFVLTLATNIKILNYLVPERVTQTIFGNVFVQNWSNTVQPRQLY